MQVSRKRKASKIRRDGDDDANVVSASKLPQMEAWPTVRHDLRWTSTNAVTGLTFQSITVANLMDALAICRVSGGLGAQIYDSIRIRRVRIWSPFVAGVPVKAYISWSGPIGGAQGNDFSKTDESINPMIPAYVSMRPPTDSLAGKWIPTQLVGQVLAIQCAANAIIQIVSDYRVDSTSAVTGTARAIVGNPAQFYFGGLDGLSVAAPSLFPSLLQLFA